MKSKIYLILSVLGFIAPNILVAKVSIETGNIMLWLDPVTTISNMFANDIATIFAIDLLFVVLVFFWWSYQESQKLNMKKPYLIWVLTMLLGLAGTFPLFLYQREKHMAQA